MKRREVWQELSEDFRTLERDPEREEPDSPHFRRRWYGVIELPVFPLVEHLESHVRP